ncbi:MAG: winged helix-turn-helix transcriptional regulator [Proteobacteria bacterium]|nr:winged helix-turn-helix transcriptional regulator [Pseudomonadota bacterium]MBS0216823.1 winged helix-turn-helix transcriptional regulator [Pseudomonadota bacterium]
MQATAQAERLDRMFFALSDSHRREMLDRLGRGATSASELAEQLDIALPSAVKHLAVLEQSGFVASEKTGRVRMYAVEPKAIRAMDAWLARHKKALNAQFDRLELHLAAKSRKPRP